MPKAPHRPQAHTCSWPFAPASVALLGWLPACSGPLPAGWCAAGSLLAQFPAASLSMPLIAPAFGLLLSTNCDAVETNRRSAQLQADEWSTGASIDGA